MSTTELAGHGRALEGLWAAAERGRLPHALLLEGPEGTGKFRAATRLARGLFCEAGPAAPCEACGPCARSRSGGEQANHPDLFVIDPDALGENQIRIGTIVERDDSPPDYLERFLRLRPVEGGWRVAILRDAHRANVDTQNALLKTLEEPSDATLLVLVSHRPERLLETIRSRVVRVRMFRLDDEPTRDLLAANGIDGPEAARLARWSRGAPGVGLRLSSEGAPAVRDLLLDVLRGACDPLVAARTLEGLEGDFPGKTPTAQRRRRVAAALDLAIDLTSDLLRAAEGAPPDELPHGDAARDLPPGTAARRVGQLETLLAARQDVDANIAPELVLELALLDLAPPLGG